MNEVIRVGPSSDGTGVPIRREDTELLLSPLAEQTPREDTEKAATRKPGRTLSPDRGLPATATVRKLSVACVPSLRCRVWQPGLGKTVTIGCISNKQPEHEQLSSLVASVPRAG